MTGSTSRISPDAGWDFRKRPTGPTGRPTCRRCGAEVGKGRRTFCGDACVHEHRIRTDPGYVRQLLWKRDRGVCRVCGRDTTEWAREVRAALAAARGGAPESRYLSDKIPAEWAVLRAAGITYGELARIPWDADHIVEVVEGGGECGLDNYQTLCCPCHKRKTAALARRRAEARKEASA